MGKFSTSSQQSTLLMIKSILVSFFLFLNGLFLLFLYPQSFLIAKELTEHNPYTLKEKTAENSLISPEVFTSLCHQELNTCTSLFILKKPFDTSKTHFCDQKSNKLNIKSHSLPLINTSLLNTKGSFSQKKNTSLKQEIIDQDDQTRSFKSFANKQSIRDFNADIYIKEWVDKEQPLQEYFSLPIQNKSFMLLLPFTYPKDKIILMHSEKGNKKHDIQSSLSFSTPCTLFSINQYDFKNAIKREKNSLPIKESFKKYHFDNNNFSLSINKNLSKPQTMNFDITQEDDLFLFLFKSPIPKRKISTHSKYLSQNFSFVSFSNIKEDFESISALPMVEKNRPTSFAKSDYIVQPVDSIQYLLPPISYKKVDLQIIKRKIEIKNFLFEKKPLNHKILEFSIPDTLSNTQPLFAQNKTSHVLQKETLSHRIKNKTINLKELKFNEKTTVINSLCINKVDTPLFSLAKHLCIKRNLSYFNSAIILQVPVLSIEKTSPLLVGSLVPISENTHALSHSYNFLEFSIKSLENFSQQSITNFYKIIDQENFLLLTQANEFSKKMTFSKVAIGKTELNLILEKLSKRAVYTDEPIPLYTSMDELFTSIIPYIENPKNSIMISLTPQYNIETPLKSPLPVFVRVLESNHPFKLYEIPYKQTIHQELQGLKFTFQGFKKHDLLQINNENPIFKQHLALSNMNWGNLLNTHGLTPKEHLPSDENIKQPSIYHKINKPLTTDFFNYKLPYYSVINTQCLNQNKTLEKELFSQNLMYESSKKVSFEKELSPQELIMMSSIPTSNPSLNNLKEASLLPKLITLNISEIITASNQSISFPQIQNIHSYSKEIIEHHHQENRASTGLISLINPKIETVFSNAEIHSINQDLRLTQKFLSELPTHSSLQTVSFENEFETEVFVSPREDKEGYHFAIKMKPSDNLCFENAEQNIIYVIDGSSSIKKDRFNAFKSGVIRSLPYLKEGDTFNIIIADTEISSLAKQSLKKNKQTTHLARKFLDSKDYRGFFINYDPFDLISKITPYFDSKKENIVVLITDGHNLNSIRHHKDEILTLASSSVNNISIFTASASQHNNLNMLDVLSTFNNGETMYSNTIVSFPRKLAIFIKHIGNCLAKDIHLHIASHSLDTGIEFYPNEQTLPSLYLDKSYMVYGTIKELKDFEIILQGKAAHHWINIKQRITFNNIEKATYAIKRDLALQKAYTCYDYYLKKSDPFFLNEAEQILEPFSMSSAIR